MKIWKTGEVPAKFRQQALDILRDRLGVEVHRVRPEPPKRAEKQTLAYEMDEVFNEILATGATLSGEATMTPNRLFNLVSVLDLTRQRGAAGLVAECGCYKGHSAYVLSRYLQNEDQGFRGGGLHLFDSFEGISPMSAEDSPEDPTIPWPRQAGLLTAPVDIVKKTMQGFPAVTIHQGWIPATLAEAPDGPYRFVHLDLDMHDPTRDSLDFFYQRLAPGGAIVSDDYGIWRWPGVAVALEAFCAKRNAPLLRLSSGQALVLAGDA